MTVAKVIPNYVRGTRGSVPRMQHTLKIMTESGARFTDVMIRPTSTETQKNEAVELYLDILIRCIQRIFWECLKLRTVMYKTNSTLHLITTPEFWDTCVGYVHSVLMALRKRDHVALHSLGSCNSHNFPNVLCAQTSSGDGIGDHSLPGLPLEIDQSCHRSCIVNRRCFDTATTSRSGTPKESSWNRVEGQGISLKNTICVPNKSNVVGNWRAGNCRAGNWRVGTRDGWLDGGGI